MYSFSVLPMNNDIDFIALDRYRAGESTPAERAAIDEWIASGTDREQLIAWMRELEAAMGRVSDPWDTPALWDRLQSGLSENAARPRPALASASPSPAPARRRWNGIPMSRAVSPFDWALRVAALVGVVLSGTVLWRTWGHPAGRTAELGMYRTIAVSAGERAALSLKDGTQVVVDAGSTLRIPHDFGVHARDVQLEGRAYFEVAADSAKPFRVHSGKAVARVLGTKFGVRSYADDSTVSVIVSEGRVALVRMSDSVTGAGSIVLNPGELGTLTVDGQLQLKSNVSVDRYLGWTSGKLQFFNTPLRSVLPDLARRYGLEIVTADHRIDTLLWSAPLQQETTALEALEQLVESLELRADRRGNRVILRFPVSKGQTR